MPSIPYFAILQTVSTGNCSVSSISAARGFTSFSAKSCMSCRISSCCLERLKSILTPFNNRTSLLSICKCNRTTDHSGVHRLFALKASINLNYSTVFVCFQVQSTQFFTVNAIYLSRPRFAARFGSNIENESIFIQKSDCSAAFFGNPTQKRQLFSADKETGSNFCNACRFLSVFKLLILFYFEFFFQLSAKYACCHFPGCIARIALRIAIRQTPTSATSAIHISA